MSRETAALSSSTVDDISQGIDIVDISDNGSISVAAVRDMNTSKREDTISEKKCTSCDQKLDNVKTNDVEIDNSSGGVKSDMLLKEEVNSGDVDVPICANCGKEGATNMCNKCKQVKYCNAACKKKHKSKHKAECEELIRRAAELQKEELKRAAELYDKELFKQPPTLGDCPKCNKRLPTLGSGRKYKACCGKVICNGCIYAVQKINKIVGICPFCKTQATESYEKYIEQLMKRVKMNDAEAIYVLGVHYAQGKKDWKKALELWELTLHLGHAYSTIGNSYSKGNGVEKDKKKAEHYYRVGAMKGCAHARHNLGVMESNAGNMDRATKHYMIAIKGGYHDSLEEIKKLFMLGYATKDEYTKALQAYQKYLDEIKTSQRDEAAAFDVRYKYIK